MHDHSLVTCFCVYRGAPGLLFLLGQRCSSTRRRLSQRLLRPSSAVTHKGQPAARLVPLRELLACRGLLGEFLRAGLAAVQVARRRGLLGLVAQVLPPHHLVQ